MLECAAAERKWSTGPNTMFELRRLKDRLKQLPELENVRRVQHDITTALIDEVLLDFAHLSLRQRISQFVRDGRALQRDTHMQLKPIRRIRPRSNRWRVIVFDDHQVRSTTCTEHFRRLCCNIGQRCFGRSKRYCTEKTAASRIVRHDSSVWHEVTRIQMITRELNVPDAKDAG